MTSSAVICQTCGAVARGVALAADGRLVVESAAALDALRRWIVVGQGRVACSFACGAARPKQPERVDGTGEWTWRPLLTAFRPHRASAPPAR